MENENICSEKLSNDLTRQFIANPISSRKNIKVVIKRYVKQYLERKKIKLVFV